MSLESRESDYSKYDRFSGKEIDDEFEKDEELSNSEEVAMDLRNFYSDVKRKLPSELNDTIEDVIETMGIYYNGNDEDWTELRDELEELIRKVDMADASDIDDKIDEEITPKLAELEKKCLELAKKKVH
jgi:hypothetical protein